MKKNVLPVILSLALLCGVLLPGAAAAENVAYASTQTVLVDGTAMEFQAYALKDANGNDTNYIKLRDVAQALNGTTAQFEVGWDGAVNILIGQSYTPNGSEMATPFSGNRAYEPASAETRINSTAVNLDAIVLKDDKGGAYTYYKLRDLGTAIGFQVNWSAEKGIFIETPEGQMPASKTQNSESVFINEANFLETVNELTIRPRHVYWEDGTLVAECFVINGLDVAAWSVNVQKLSFADVNGNIIADAAFGNLEGAQIGAHSYLVWTFRFGPDCVVTPNANLATLNCHSTVAYDHGQTLQQFQQQQQMDQQFQQQVEQMNQQYQQQTNMFAW